MKKGLIRQLKNIAIITIASSLLCSCNTANQEKVNDYESQYMFDTKCAVEEGEDGWVYYFCCDYDKGNDTPDVYYYEGHNLKYKSMEGYVIDMRDEDGTVIQSMEAPMVSLVYNEKYDEDMEAIEEYFEKNTPTDVISGDELQLTNLNGEHVIKLFNQAISSEKMKAGKYYNLPASAVEQEKAMDGYCWQVGYVLMYGQILSVDIELIYEGDIHLSDIVAAGEADENQEKLEAVICNIEDKIVEKQEFCVDNSEFERIKGVSGSRLKSMLKGIDKRSQE